MKRGKQVLFGLLATACVVVVLALPVTPTTPGDLPIRDHDWIEEVYAPFDSLGTDPDDYLWPTDASVRMSSGFAEYRRTHFHAGIDISTNGQRGYRVYAARDGYISRIHTNPYGYGKMLHVTHADGFVTTYAHLQRFSTAIEAFARGIQYAKGRYAIDVAPDRDLLPVRRGDVIAYTGDTGIGAPHLHFEVRDRHLNPINPFRLAAVSRAITDNVAPEFHRVGFIPLDYRSRVNRSPRPWNSAVARHSSDRFTISKRIHLDGAFGMVIKGSDRVTGSYHRSGIYQLELYLNDSLIYRSRLDQVSAIESRQIALYYDWPSLLGGDGRFQKLFVEKGNRLPLYDRQPEGFGIIDTRSLPEGKHMLRVVALDIRGNRSELDVPVVCSRIPEITLASDSQGLVVHTDTSGAIETLTVATRTPLQTKWNDRSYRLSDLEPFAGGYRLPFTNRADVDVRVIAGNRHGISSDPRFLISNAAKGKHASLDLEREIARNYLIVQLFSPQPFASSPELSIVESGRRHKVETYALNERSVVGTFPLSQLAGDRLTLYAEAETGGRSTSTTDRLTLFRVTPSDERTISYDDSTIVVFFAPESVYDTLYFQIHKDDDSYSLFPKDVLLKRGIRVHHQVPADRRADNTGLFLRDDGEKRLIGRWDPGNPEFITGESTRLLGDVWLMRDTVPPSLSSLRVSATRSHLRFSFRISDDRAGVDPNGFRISVGEEVVIAEYDPYKRLVHYEGKHSLDPGTHQLSVHATDRLGNAAAVKRSFSIPR